MVQQLLDLFDTTPSFSNFIAIKNEAVVLLLQNFKQQYIHLVGAPLSGKSHLLHATVTLAKQQNKTAIFIPSAKISNWLIPHIVDQFDCIAIDDVDQLNHNQQIAVFNLFNQIKLNNLSTQLLTCSNKPLALCYLREDLTTRLLAGINVSLHALDDNEMAQALNLYAKHAGIGIADTEINYLINNHTRNLGRLIQIMNRLATSAIREHRNITIPFIKAELVVF